MTAKRVLFLNGLGIVGGQEVVMLDVIRRLDRRKYEPVAATLVPGPLVDALRDEGVEVHVLPPHRMRQPHRVLLTLASLNRILSRERIDVVHCNGDTLLFYGALAAAPLRVPCVWHVYEPVATRGSAFASLFYETQKRMRPAWTVFGTAAVEESYIKHYPRLGRYSAIMPGVDVDWLTSGADAARARAHYGIAEGAPIILTIGRLQRSKGHRELLEAVARLSGASSGAHVVLCGGPPVGTDEDFPEALRRLSSDLGISERTHFTGHVSDEEKKDLLAAATVLVHPAHREAFGIAVIEGMAAGKPVVVTDCVGPTSILEGSRAGEMVPRKNVAELAAAIERVLGDPVHAARLGEAGRAHVRKRYSAESLASRVSEIYDAVLTRAS